MNTPALCRVELMVDQFDDGTPGSIAFCDDMPEFVGHGETEEEATQDWLDQYFSRALH